MKWKNPHDFLKEENNSGHAAVELIIVFPAFLLLCLLVLELCLFWVAKHHMHLAAFEASRMLSYSDQTCSDHNPMMNQAKQRAVLRMASVTPSIGSLARGLGYQGSLGGLESVNSPSPALSQKLTHLATRLPSAMALISLKCSPESNKDKVQVQLTYQRPPSLPFVGGVLWASYMLLEINEFLKGNGLSEILAIDLDDLYFGFKFHSPALSQIQVELAQFRQKLRSGMKELNSLSGGLNKVNQTLNSWGGWAKPFAQKLKVPNVITSAYQSTINITDQAMTNTLNAQQSLQNSMQEQANFLAKLVYAIPDAARLIPTHTEISYAKPQLSKHQKAWKNGRAHLIAPFTGEGGGYDHWSQYFRELAQRGDR